MNRYALLLLATPGFLFAQETPIVRSQFIFESAPYPSVHASTIVETRSGFAAAWFGGSRESASDVTIWFASRRGAQWTTPVQVADGVQADGKRYPCWNPVLFRGKDSVLSLYYKVGPSPREWWGMVRTSNDDGAHWSEPRRLPDGILGPIKNKPIELAQGTLISPSSTESMDSPPKWRVHFERSIDNGNTWTIVRPVQEQGTPIGAIQPSILVHANGDLEAVGRTESGRVFESWSRDQGRTWSALTLGELPNPNSGLDATTLRDGRQLIVYNHTLTGRTPLNVSVSRDGKSWNQVLTLESQPGEYSYPAVIQSRDGLVHITYTWHRERIRYVVIDPAKLR